VQTFDWAVYGPAAGVIVVLVAGVKVLWERYNAVYAELTAYRASEVAIREKRIVTLVDLFTAKVATDAEQVAALRGVQEAVCELSRRVESLEDTLVSQRRSPTSQPGNGPRPAD